jgi:transglutaminase-like putative cysteine protease
MKHIVCTILLLACTEASARAEGKPRKASFDVRQEFTLTAESGAKKLRAWLTMPQRDPNQTVSVFKIESPVPYRVVKDSEGNQLVYIEVANPPRELKVVERFRLTRREQRSGVDPAKTRPIGDAERKRYAKYLGPNTNVIIDQDIVALAAQITGGEKNPVLAARKLYDWTLENVDYWVKYPERFKASGIGSTSYCLANRTGNCTDFHSLWTSLARASGIPTQMVYGSFLKKELDGKDQDQSYHCWPEFYAPKIGWVPHDVAIADIFMGDFPTTKENDEKVRLTTGAGYNGADRAKVDYYFGNIDERRVTWSRGRDLTLSPKQDGGPVNALAKAYVEVDGVPVADGKGWTRKLTFTEVL